MTERPIMEATPRETAVYYSQAKRASEKDLATFLEASTGSLSVTVRAAVEHGVLNKGKRVRPVVTRLIHDMVRGENPSHPHIGQLSLLAELPHRGSVMEDDIDDHALSRNGEDATYRVFGPEDTKEAYNFLYAAPLFMVASLPLDPEQKRRINEEYIRLAKIAREGQKKDIEWGEEDIVPSIDDYLLMCEQKGAALEAAVLVGAELGGATIEQTAALGEVGRKLATAFQLEDDLLSLQDGRPDFGDDITGGKKTIPVIHTLETEASGSERLTEILKMETEEPVLIREAVSILQESGGIRENEEVLKRLVGEARDIIVETFPDSNHRKILLSLISYGLQRAN